MAHLLDKRFVVIAGKDGVGRTTVSLVLGHLAARRGRRVLVCLCNAPQPYLEHIGEVEIDATIRTVSENLDVINLEPRASQEEYGHKIVRNRTVHRLVFGSRVVRGFLDVVPGLAEWALLGKATFHAMEKVDDKLRYDMVVFDAPATGHGLDILALPRAIVSSVPSGQMREEAWARCKLMEDATLCEIIPVTLPEEVGVRETIGFVSDLDHLGLSVQRIAVNMVMPKMIGSELTGHVATAGEKGELPSWLLPPATALARQQMQEESVELLSSIKHVDYIQLPLIQDVVFDGAAMKRLVKVFSTSIRR
ncbi:MAG: ArsA family ATPase [Proteobacteria bacterium]|nr:ArsA family ATPase [Pseudomonadota bacterium]